MASFYAESNTYDGRKLSLNISGSGSSNTNSTVLTWKLTSSGGTNNYYAVAATDIVINGTKVYHNDAMGYTNHKFPVAKDSVSGTIEIPHNSDGTKTIDISFKTRVYYSSAVEYGGTLKLDDIALRSIPTVNVSSAKLGSTSVTISTNRNSNSFTHIIKTYIGGTLVETFNGIGESKTWIPSLENYAPYIQNSPSAVCSITCETFNNSNSLGLESCSLNFEVPSTAKPTAKITSVTEADSTMKNLNWGVYVQGKSKLSIKVSGYESYESPITNYSISVDDKNYSSNDVTTSILGKTGSQLISASVKDARGNTSDVVTYPYSVISYSNPTISKASAARCTSDGTLSDEGTYLLYTFEGNIAPVNNKNSKTFRIGYKVRGASTYTYVNIEESSYSISKINQILPNITFDTNTSYDIVFEVIDAFLTSKYEKEIGTGFDLINFHKNGKSIAFGKVSEASDDESIIEMGLDVSFDKSIIFNRGTTSEISLELEVVDEW